MKLSVSQIAFPTSGLSTEILAFISDSGFAGIDIAPTKMWPNWDTNEPSMSSVRGIMSEYGLNAAGMQSLFYGTNGLNLFGEGESWAGFLAHFQRLCHLATELDVCALVFGSPKNRDPRLTKSGNIDVTKRVQALGDIAEAYGCCLCIEPVPLSSGGNFLTSTCATLDFVEAVNHPSVCINLDSAVLSNEKWTLKDLTLFIERNIKYIGHVHASEPGLGGFTRPLSVHANLASALKACNYQKYVAIEMRSQGDWTESITNLSEAMRYVKSVYL